MPALNLMGAENLGDVFIDHIDLLRSVRGWETAAAEVERRIVRPAISRLDIGDDVGVVRVQILCVISQDLAGDGGLILEIGQEVQPRVGEGELIDQRRRKRGCEVCHDGVRIVVVNLLARISVRREVVEVAEREGYRFVLMVVARRKTGSCWLML